MSKKDSSPKGSDLPESPSSRYALRQHCALPGRDTLKRGIDLSRIRTRKFGFIALALVGVAALVIGVTQVVTRGPSVGPGGVTDLAVLTIFSGQVSVLAEGESEWSEGSDNMPLQVGDRVRTDADSYALITFLEGSTFEMDPETEVSIVNVEAAEDGSTTVQLKQWLGKSWSRVESLVDAGSSYDVESSSTVAAARGTLIGVEVKPDGTTMTRVFEGEVEATGQGQKVLLGGGKEAHGRMGRPLSRALSITLPSSQLRVSIGSSAFLQLIDPLERSAGIVPPGVKVNQIPKANTSGSPDRPQTVEIDGPMEGEYIIILYTQEDGPASLGVQGISQDKVKFDETQTLQLKKGRNYQLSLQVGVEKSLITQLELGEIKAFAGDIAGKVVIMESVLEKEVEFEADFVADDKVVAVDQAIQFTNLSSGEVTSWSWDFGDGQTSSEQNPKHSYAEYGTYSVSLTVSNADGSHKKTKYIVVYDQPTADFEAELNEVYAGQAVWFEDKSSGSPSEWAWDFGDGRTSGERYPCHRYADPGTYTVSLTVTNAAGSDSLIKSEYVIVYPAPWPMLHHDVKHTGQGDYPGSQELSLKWSRPTEGAISRSSPTVSGDGTIYIASNNGELYVLNPEGIVLWSYPTKGGTGFSAVTGTDGTIYVSFTDGVHAIHPSGVQKWSYLTERSVCSSPVIGDDGTIYFGCYGGMLYALNSDGTLRWHYDTGDALYCSAPALGEDGTLYVSASDGSLADVGDSNAFDGGLHAVDSSGELKWKYDTGSAIVASPAIGADGTIYVCSTDGTLYALDPSGLSTLKWSYTAGGGIHSSPAVGADGTIYVGASDGNLYAIDGDGTLKWSYVTGDDILAAPSLDSNGTIYVGSTDGTLYAIGSDGSLKASYVVNDAILSSPAIGADGTVYVAFSDGELCALG